MVHRAHLDDPTLVKFDPWRNNVTSWNSLWGGSEPKPKPVDNFRKQSSPWRLPSSAPHWTSRSPRLQEPKLPANVPGCSQITELIGAPVSETPEPMGDY